MIARKKQAAAPAAPPGNNEFSLICEAKLLELYRALLQCRMFDEHARALLKQNKLPASCRRSLGREASAVGVAIDLLPEDTLAVSHGLSALLVRGEPLRQLYASLCSYAGNGRSTAGSAWVKTTARAAVQAAETAKAEKSHRVAVVFCGAQGGKSPAPASWRKAMRRAGAGSLPMIFVCHSDSDAKDRDWKAERYGFPGIVVDGNDVVAIYRVASEAIAHARRGNGPTLIECRITRQRGAAKRPDRPAGDPVFNLENYLSRKGLFTAELKAEVTARFKRKLQSAQRVLAPGAGAHE